ncbi:mechanosensitive ion channel family protein [Helicobacter sp. 11S02596-1]|uniref:mechanosensitive ion channel family protein n=1 Tax=Helicobacter sp. 11S02596-1 TaxID=1476194 RepID=UPI000BA523F7|nr:mechanosensitive ion channel family protein [Helicobacter sp. 11S02596-1]PAF44853.1 hypothetical protein BJI48_02375 [Helicobacter sp. 11S02596-1]
MANFTDSILDFFHITLPFIQDISLSLLKAIIILFVGFYLARLARKKTHTLIAKKDEILGNFISQVASIGIIIITIVTMLSNIGVQTTSILTLLGTIGVAIALALKDSLSSIAGGIILIVLRPFKKNDTIEIGQISGKIEAINLFNTKIALPDGKLAVLPNRNVANATIINCSHSQKRRIEWIFQAPYNTDIQKVREILKNVLTNLEKTKKVQHFDSKNAFIGVSDLSPESLTFTIRVWIKNQDSHSFKSELIEKTKEAFDSAQIQIPPDSLEDDSLKALEKNQ